MKVSKVDVMDRHVRRAPPPTRGSEAKYLLDYGVEVICPV
jgi:hypothetical protein